MPTRNATSHVANPHPTLCPSNQHRQLLCIRGSIRCSPRLYALTKKAADRPVLTRDARLLDLSASNSAG